MTELGKDMHQKFSIDFLSNSKFAKWATEWDKGSEKPFKELFKDIIEETQEYLRTTYKLIMNNASDFDALSKLGCYKNETKGSGTSTVIAGIYLTCKYSNDPLKGVEQAVNSIGTDTDSIAAFTGGLLGALHGQSIIPNKWKRVQDIDYLDAMSIRLLEISESRANFKTINQNKHLTSIANTNEDIFEINQNVFLSTLGVGKIKSIDRQNTLTKGKYNLILDIEFEIGQFCRFAKLLDVEEENKKDLFTDSLEKDVNLFNSLNLDFDTKERIERFMESLNDSKQKEFKEIIKLIEKRAKR